MNRAFVELSQESVALATAEAAAAAEALGGHLEPAENSEFPSLAVATFPEADGPRRWVARLALARRGLELRGGGREILPAAEAAGKSGKSGAFRRLGRPSAADDPLIPTLGRAFKAAGGSIDLERPQRRFWVHDGRDGAPHLFEEIAAVDRASVAARRMPLLPFQRPVSLPPKLARAAANLSRARPQSRVLDPFLGTGALLAEAALLGARVCGIDRDPTMVRGALRNFQHLGVSAEEFLVGDAATVDFAEPGHDFDAILTDPPYGRSSSTGGEEPDRLLESILPRWGERVRAAGRIVLIVPTGAREVGAPWKLVLAVPVRVHRSLTREFRVYERAPA